MNHCKASAASLNSHQTWLKSQSSQYALFSFYITISHLKERGRFINQISSGLFWWCFGKAFHHHDAEKLEETNTWAEGDASGSISLFIPCQVPAVSLHVWRPWHLFASVPDVQQGDTQTQRGTRKGTPPVWLMCVKSHNYSYLLKKPFPAHSPHLFFFLSFMIYVKRLHFGQAHGGLRFSSNANCSLWLSAHNVILSPTLCVWRWVEETVVWRVDPKELHCGL